MDTDVIIPARYLNTADHKELAAHCMEDIDTRSFKNNVRPGDIMAAGWNFGCGSSREHAPIAIKASGVSCVIAKPLPAFSTATPSTSACPFWSARPPATASRRATRCDVDFDTGVITNVTKNETYQAQPLPAVHSEHRATGAGC